MKLEISRENFKGQTLQLQMDSDYTTNTTVAAIKYSKTAQDPSSKTKVRTYLQTRHTTHDTVRYGTKTNEQ